MDHTAFDYLDALAQHEYKINPAAEQLRLRLNELIDEQDLDMLTIMAALARLSAAYVHQMQQTTSDASTRQMLEDQYYELFQAYLALCEETDKHKQQQVERQEQMKKN